MASSGTTDAVSAMASQATQKLSSAANDIREAMAGGLSAMFGGSAKQQEVPADRVPAQSVPKQQKPTIAGQKVQGDKLNFDDDEQEWREIQMAKEASLRQAKRDEEVRVQRALAEQQRL